MPHDYQWLLEAAGNDHEKLATLMMLLTAYVLMITHVGGGDMRVARDIAQLTYIVEEIGKRMGHDFKSDVFDQLRATVRKAARMKHRFERGSSESS